jgi:hypothetical protein
MSEMSIVRIQKRLSQGRTLSKDRKFLLSEFNRLLRASEQAIPDKARIMEPERLMSIEVIEEENAQL